MTDITDRWFFFASFRIPSSLSFSKNTRGLNLSSNPLFNLVAIRPK